LFFALEHRVSRSGFIGIDASGDFGGNKSLLLPIFSLPLAIPGRLRIGEFDHVRDGDSAPIGRHAVALFIPDILRGDHGAAVANDDHPGIYNVIGGVFGQPNSERLERLIIELANYIVMRHSTYHSPFLRALEQFGQRRMRYCSFLRPQTAVKSLDIAQGLTHFLGGQAAFDDQ
jgi:hypothetical protein